MKISDVVTTTVKGLWGTDYSTPEDGIAVIKTNNMSYEGVIDYSDICYRNIELEKAQKNFLKYGDILAEKSGGTKTHTVGYVSYFDGQSDKYVCNNFILVIRPNVQKIKSKFLFYQMRYMYENGIFADCYNRTTGIQNLQVNSYLGKDIKVFSEDKQEKIVSLLDSIISEIDNSKKRLSALDELVKSRFIEMFENKDFGECLFEDICDCLRNGANIKQSKTASGYPITRIETLSNDKFNLDRMGYADIFDLEKYRKYLLQTDDILISHINSTAYLGRAVRYKGESNTPIIHGMNLLCARIKPMYNATYIEHYLKSVRAKDYIRSITKQAVNQASISTTELKLMPISVPPIELQNEFAEFVKLIDKSKFIVQQQIKDLQELLDSKMDEYFR